MNKERYVSYKIAKLLKEKGFDWQTDFVWYEHLPPSIDWRNKANQKAMDYFYFNETTEHHSYYRNCDKKPSYISGDIYSAPTIQMALRWLREVNNIFIGVDIGEDIDGEFGYMPFIHILDNLSCSDGRYVPHVDADQICYSTPKTYEEAVEIALGYCLTDLI